MITMKSILPLAYALFVLSFALPSSPALADDPFGAPAAGAGIDVDIKPTDVIIWEPVEALIEADGSVTVGLRLTTKQNFSIYRERVKFKAPAGYTLASSETPTTKTITDPIDGKTVEVYTGGDFVLKFTGLEPYRADVFPLDVTFLGCTERICLFPYTQNFEIPAYHASAEAPAPSPTAAAVTPATDSTPSSTADTPAESGDLQQELAARLGTGELSLAILLVIVFAGGLLTNLTPCVFPMLPITIRLLANQSGSPVVGSSLYALGIMITYSALGIVAALTGGLFGSMLASTTVNLVYAALFVLLGMTMLGFGNLSALQNFGSRIGSGPSSKWNTFLMGTGAGLVAAPCTGPILGALLVLTAKTSDPSRSAFLMIVYSAGFALPYIFLGMAAGRVSKVKVSPVVQVGIKLLFAAFMFGLALYYLRVPLYDLVQSIKGSWYLVAYVGLAIGIVVSLAYLMVPNLSRSKAAGILPAVVLGIGLFGASQMLTGGDLKSAEGLTWHHSEDEGIAAAKASRKPIMIDGWAEWCEACKKMDATTFHDAAVIEELKNNWTTIKLDLTELSDANEALATKYDLVGLPTLILMPPDGDLARAKKIVGEVSAAKLLEELRAFAKE